MLTVSRTICVHRNHENIQTKQDYQILLHEHPESSVYLLP